MPPRRAPAHPARSRFAPSPRRLLINQGIPQAAVRRLNAVEAWLDAGVLTRDLCGGGIGIADLGAGQLLVNQRISQAAVRRASGLADTLATGLTGAEFLDGSITAIDLAPGLG